MVGKMSSVMMSLYVVVFTDLSSILISPTSSEVIAPYTMTYGEWCTVRRSYSVLKRSPFLDHTLAPPSYNIFPIQTNPIVDRSFFISRGFFAGRHAFNPIPLNRRHTVLVLQDLFVRVISSFSFEEDWKLPLIRSCFRRFSSRAFKFWGLAAYVSPSFEPVWISLVKNRRTGASLNPCRQEITLLGTFSPDKQII